MSTSYHRLAIALAVASGISSTAQAAKILETITITSSKKQQSLQESNIAVTAFSGDALRELNLTDSTDIASQTPGLNIGTPVGEGNNPSISLRGVGLNDFNDNNNLTDFCISSLLIVSVFSISSDDGL